MADNFVFEKSLNSKELPKERSINRKRKKILNEIYETEKTYQYHLMLLTTLFLEPIQVASVLPPRVVEGIFSNIQAIQSVTSHLLEMMEEQGIAHALLELAPYMKLYSLYANNFDSANKLLEEHREKNADFARLLKFQESREEMQSLRFAALLVTPIQRVPRYRLLLENLLEKTFEDDPDFPKLKDAFEKVSKVATHINECVRQHENFHKMLSIQNSFTGSTAPKILLPGRFYIREGVVTKITERGNAKERMLFLFNDMLLCAKKETSCTYRCCDIFPLLNCIVEQVLGSLSAGNGLFRVIRKDRSMLLCANLNENSWISTIKTTVSELHSNLASLRRFDHGSVSAKDYKNISAKVKSPKKGMTSSSSSSRLRRLPYVSKPPAMTRNISKRWTCLELNNNEDDKMVHDDMFYGMSSSLTSTSTANKTEFSTELSLLRYSQDEVFSPTEPIKPKSSTHRINWTLSEPAEIECRRPLHSLASSAKTIGGKFGCNSTKRKLEKNVSMPYLKEDCKRRNIESTSVTRISNELPKEEITSSSCVVM